MSVTSNEKRCEQCHAGYGKDGKSARDPANAGNATLVDCLICHSGLVKGNMRAGYAKVQANFGAAGYTVTAAATAEQPNAAASAIQRPTRDNCGFCHFNAGGADSVKDHVDLAHGAGGGRRRAHDARHRGGPRAST